MVVANEFSFDRIGFTGLSLTQTEDSEIAEDTELTIATNFLLDKDGSLRKRYPVSQFTSLTSDAANPAPWTTVIGQLKLVSGLTAHVYTLIVTAETSGNKIYYLTDNGTSPTLISAMNGEIIWGGCQYGGKFYIATEGSVWHWDPVGGAVDDVTSPPSLRGLFAFRDRLFGWVQDRLQWTEPGDGLDWAVDNILYVNKGDGIDINCVLPYGDQLMIFKGDSIWALYLNDDPTFWYLRQLTTEFGCTGPWAAKIAGGLIYFIDHRGFGVTDGIYFNRLYDENASYGFHPYNLSVAIQNSHVSVYSDWIVFKTPQNLMVYHWKDPKGWTRWDFIPSLAVGLNSPIFEQELYDLTPRWLMGIGLLLYTFVDFADSPVEQVAAELQTKSYDLGSLHLTKRIKHAFLYYRKTATGNSEISWLWDGERSSAGIVLTAEDDEVLSKRVSANQVCRTVALNVDDTTGRAFVFHGFSLVGQMHRGQAGDM